MILAKILEFLSDILIEKEPDLKIISKLSEEEVERIAQGYAESIGCDLNEFIQNSPHLTYKRKKLIWDVFFSPTKDGLPVKGGHLRLLIDDETGKIIKEFVGTR